MFLVFVVAVIAMLVALVVGVVAKSEFHAGTPIFTLLLILQVLIDLDRCFLRVPHSIREVSMSVN